MQLYVALSASLLRRPGERRLCMAPACLHPDSNRWPCLDGARRRGICAASPADAVVRIVEFFRKVGFVFSVGTWFGAGGGGGREESNVSERCVCLGSCRCRSVSCWPAWKLAAAPSVSGAYGSCSRQPGSLQPVYSVWHGSHHARAASFLSCLKAVVGMPGAVPTVFSRPIAISQGVPPTVTHFQHSSRAVFVLHITTHSTHVLLTTATRTRTAAHSWPNLIAPVFLLSFMQVAR